MSASNDTTPPYIDLMSIMPPTVAAGGSVAVQVRLTDNGTGVVGGSVRAIRSPGTTVPLDAPLTLESGTPFDGIWRGVITVPASFAAGLYGITVYDVVDAAGNRTSPYNGGGASFTVTGGTNDTTAPLFGDVVATTSTVAAGGNVTISARIGDALTGVASASVHIVYGATMQSPLDAPLTLASGTPQDGTWRATIPVPAAYPSGGYYGAQITATDVAGNIATMQAGNISFTVTGGSNDTHAPGFGTVSATPNPVVLGQSVTITIVIGDDFTGVAGNPTITVYHYTSLSSVSGALTLVSGTPLLGTWQATLVIPPLYPSGYYYFQALTPMDAAGNKGYQPVYGSIQVIEAPAPTITGVNPTTSPQDGKSPLTVTGTNFAAGATVTVGGAAASGVVVVNNTTITALTPPHLPGPVDVVVTNPDGQHATLSGALTVIARAPDARFGPAPTPTPPAPLPLPRSGGGMPAPNPHPPPR